MRLLERDGATPLVFVDVEGEAKCEETVLLYGHLDKQPPGAKEKWVKGTGPYTPKIIDGKLYGRGGADDGYAVFLIIAADSTWREPVHSIPVPPSSESWGVS